MRGRFSVRALRRTGGLGRERGEAEREPCAKPQQRKKPQKGEMKSHQPFSILRCACEAVNHGSHARSTAAVVHRGARIGSEHATILMPLSPRLSRVKFMQMRRWMRFLEPGALCLLFLGASVAPCFAQSARAAPADSASRAAAVYQHGMSALQNGDLS